MCKSDSSRISSFLRHPGHFYIVIFLSFLNCSKYVFIFSGTYPPITTTKLKTLFLLEGLLESSDDVVVPMAKVVIIKHKWKYIIQMIQQCMMMLWGKKWEKCNVVLS